MVNFLYWSVLVLTIMGFGVGSYARTQTPSGTVENPVRLLNSFFETIMSARRHLVSAAVARGVSILGMYPLDTIKTRIQIEHPKPFSLKGLYGAFLPALTE